jgi:hypothetical protein
MNTSETVTAIFTALSSFNGDLKDAEKRCINPHLKSKYADLPAQFEVLRPALHKHGLCLTQTTYVEGNILMLKTILGHKSGEWISSDYPVCAFPAKQQEIGASLTYSRRYQSAAITMLASDFPDNDAEDAPKPVPAPPPKKPEPVIEPMNEEQSTEARKKFMAQLAEITTRAQLKTWTKDTKAERDRMTVADIAAVRTEYNNIDADLKG